MNQNTKNPLIEWCSINNKNCLKFTFNGILKKEDAVEATKEWKDLFSAANITDVNIVWHCIEMKGYEPMARSVWQNTLKELKSKIACIWLITESKVVKTGALIMSVFTSYELKVVSSEDKIEI
ncbi:hypothetical protein ACFLTE_03105 [Bacteroidota bacterium]